MVARSAILFLSRQEGLKDFATRFRPFKKLTTRFVAGENIEEAVAAIRELNAHGATASFDHLNEGVTNKGETEAEVREYTRVLARIDETGIKSNVSIKLTQFGLDIEPELTYRNARAVVDEAARRGNFVRVMRVLLASGVYHGIATHDEKMIDVTVDFAAREGIPKSAFEFQMLYGVRRDLQVKLARAGYNMRVYVPYGKTWYPYFMRRL